MNEFNLEVEDLAAPGSELDEEQLLAVSGGAASHSKTLWVACGCTDCDQPF